MKVKKESGMTLIELMVVVAIIGVLMAVAIPKYGDLLEKANLGATLGNLSSLRSAVGIYYGVNMQYPGTLDPKIQPGMDKVMPTMDMPFVKAKYPSNNSPYGNDIFVGTAMPTGMDRGWYYDKGRGFIYINSTANDVKGTPYTDY